MKSSRLRRVALGIIFGVSVGLVVAFAIILAVRGEKLPEITPESLAAARALWKENAPPSYDLDVKLSGINTGRMHVEVRRGEVTAMKYNDRPAADLHTGEYWTVSGLFDVIERDLESCAEAAKKGSRDATTPIFSRGLFDPRFGYPVTYRRITPSGTDAEWQITRFYIK
jgi:hypothetical protein